MEYLLLLCAIAAIFFFQFIIVENFITIQDAIDKRLLNFFNEQTSTGSGSTSTGSGSTSTGSGSIPKVMGPVTLTNFGPCKKRDTQGKCIERYPIGELSGIELDKIRERITGLNTQVGEFGSKVVSSLDTFRENAKNKLTGCFGTKDSNECNKWKDKVCEILGEATCLERECSSWFAGLCTGTRCKTRGDAPCLQWADPVCDNWVQVPTWNC